MNQWSPLPSKLVLLGDVGAGKSSVVLRFVKGQFIEFQVGRASFDRAKKWVQELQAQDVWPRNILLPGLCILLIRESPEGEVPHLCQRPFDQAGRKSRDVHEWQGPEGESQ
ncbi:Small GTPase superfamily [Forsythia ovata]|uniref:Small GTPase superfamily n=1 Tax=Forsythia ovata TaxID=205694 RepID=A0ABD1QEE4_9LAMI